MYLTFLLSALETALGSDFDLGQTEGLAQLGQFRMYSIGPSGRQLNYADAIEEPAAAPQMLWMAGRYDRPEYARARAWLACALTGRPQCLPCVVERATAGARRLVAADLRAFQEHRRRGASQRLARQFRFLGGLESRQQCRDSRSPRPWQLHHRRAGASVGGRSGAGPFQSPGLFWRAPVDLLQASHREPQHAARRRAEPGRERNCAHRRVRRRLVSGLRRHGPDRRVSSGAYASTAGRCPDRRARRADSG